MFRSDLTNAVAAPGERPITLVVEARERCYEEPRVVDVSGHVEYTTVGRGHEIVRTIRVRACEMPQALTAYPNARRV